MAERSARLRSGASWAIAALLMAGAAQAGSVDANGNYHGVIPSVAVGFFGEVGVALEGVTCNGQRVAILLTSNAQYKDMLATLLAAQATGVSAVIYDLPAITQCYPGGYCYCVITAVSLGEFPLW